MNIKTTFLAIPLFWKIYLFCMILAACRMGDPGWEWAPARYSPWSAFMVSAQETPLQDTEVIIALSINLPH